VLTSRVVLVLSVAALTYSLAQTTIISALAELEHAFDAGTTSVAWTYSGFLLASAVATPLLGRLGDMFGRRRMLLVALAMFFAGSVVAALADSLVMVVVGRCIQGLGGGIFPVCFAIARDLLPEHQRRRGIGAISATIGIGGGLGLLVGGLLVDNVSWQSTFWANAGLAAAAALAVYWLIPESGVRSPGRVDAAGAVLLGIGVVLPLLAVTRTPTWGWTDPRTIVLALAGFAVLFVWWQHERRTAHPLVDIALTSRRPVLLTNAATFLAGLGIFGSFLALPQIASVPVSDSGLGLTATQIGLLLLPGATLMLFAGPLAGFLGDRFGSRLPLILGVALGALGLALLGFGHARRAEVLVFTLPMYVGMGLAFAAMPNLIVDSVPASQTGEATGVNALIRSAGAGLGGVICASVLAAHTGAAGLPTSSGFTAAFLLGAALAGLGACAALAVPRHPTIPQMVVLGGPLDQGSAVSD
jgi:EmrB/QacA subfamily drug resistance transporter